MEVLDSFNEVEGFAEDSGVQIKAANTAIANAQTAVTSLSDRQPAG